MRCITGAGRFLGRGAGASIAMAVGRMKGIMTWRREGVLQLLIRPKNALECCTGVRRCMGTKCPAAGAVVDGLHTLVPENAEKRLHQALATLLTVGKPPPPPFGCFRVTPEAPLASWGPHP